MENGCLLAGQVIGASNTWGEGVVDRVYNAWLAGLWNSALAPADCCKRMVQLPASPCRKTRNLRQYKAIERSRSSGDEAARRVDGRSLRRIIVIFGSKNAVLLLASWQWAALTASAIPGSGSAGGSPVQSS